MHDKPVEVALKSASVKLAEKGIQKVTNMHMSIPGIRTGVAVYSVFMAGREEEMRIQQAIDEQRELLHITNYLAPAISEIVELINSVSCEQRAKEYYEVLGSMINKKAELTVYRQLQYERHRMAVTGIERDILRKIDYNLAIRVTEGRETPIAHRQVMQVAIAYAMGEDSKANLDFAIRNYIEANKPFMESSAYVDRVFNSLNRELRSLDNAREAINKYGGSAMSYAPKLRYYGELLSTIGYERVVMAETGQSGTFTDLRDGNTYRWVRVGNQVWMTENLAYRPRTGNYWVTDNNFPNLSRYGYLYDYQTAVYVCPDGWNLPGQNDWVNLFNVAGYKGSDLVSATGLQLFDQVESLIDLESQLAGFRTSDGSFKMAEQSGVWWSITPFHSLALHTFVYEQSQPDVEDMAQNIEDYAFSVRCLKDHHFELSIQVLDERGRPAPNVQVELENVTKQYCHWALTDQRGMVTFDLVRMPEIISISGLVYEEKYGATFLIPEINLYSYTVTIPDHPWSESMVTEQTNNLVDLIFKGYNMLSTADYINNLLTHMQATGLSKVQLGVPTVFSINLLPKSDKGGQLVFEVNGRLADDIFKMLYNINPMFYGTIQGRDARFNLGESH